MNPSFPSRTGTGMNLRTSLLAAALTGAFKWQ